MKKNNPKSKLSYEPEADVLMLEISGQPINHAKEVGNVVIHFTKNNIPVLFEILEASRFLARAEHLLKKSGIGLKKTATTTS